MPPTTFPQWTGRYWNHVNTVLVRDVCGYPWKMASALSRGLIFWLGLWFPYLYSGHVSSSPAWISCSLVRVGTQGTHTVVNLSKKKGQASADGSAPGLHWGWCGPALCRSAWDPQEQPFPALGLRLCLVFLAAVTPAGGQAAPTPMTSGVALPVPAS